MVRRARAARVTAAAVLVTGWCVVQLLLCNRIAAGYRGHVFPPFSGLQLAEPSMLAMVALAVLAAALVGGGRSWWALLVAGMPASSVVGWFWDGEPLGIGWAQNSAAIREWLAIGTAIDTLWLLAIAALLLGGLPRRDAAMPARTVLPRLIPVVVVLVGWWVTHRDYGDPDDRVWIVQATLALVVVGLLAGSGLPLWARAAAILGLPILAYPITANSVIHRVDGMQVGHHMLFLAATAVYVAGVPWLQATRGRLAGPAAL